MKRTGKSELLGVSFEAVAMDTAVARCLEFCRAPRTSHTVITANASHLCMMRRDQELAQSCRAAHLTVADGMSVVWALRASGQPAPERVAGVDLMSRLLAAAGEHRLRVYFLGARREVVTALVQTARAQWPGIEIAGFRDGYFGPDDHLNIVEEIRASRAHMLFVGMPSPFKEVWCERHRERLECAGHHRRRRQLRCIGRLHQTRPTLGAGAGAGVVVAASDGAPQALEALPDDQLRVRLACGPGDRRAPPGQSRWPHMSRPSKAGTSGTGSGDQNAQHRWSSEAAFDFPQV